MVSQKTEIKQPMLTIMMCCRIFSRLDNADAPNIFGFFDSVMAKLKKDDRHKVEFLIRFDKDDNVAKQVIFEEQRLKKYPLNIRTFCWRAWEGVLTLHYSYTSMLIRKNINSKFIGFASDDAIIASLSTNLLPQLEEEYDNDFIFFALDSRFHTKTMLDDFKDYRHRQGRMAEPYPILSTKLVQICGLIGWHRNTDNWLGLINHILYAKYGISLCKKLKGPYIIRINLKPEHLFYSKGWHSKYNHDIMGSATDPNSYYFDLVEQQAENIYLNIKERGLLKKYKL